MLLKYHTGQFVLGFLCVCVCVCVWEFGCGSAGVVPRYSFVSCSKFSIDKSYNYLMFIGPCIIVITDE